MADPDATTDLERANSRRHGSKRAGMIFEKAREFLKPGPLFQRVSYLYAERKAVTFLAIHILCTLGIWAHYGIQKYEVLKETISEDEPHYVAQRVIPPFVYGSKHAILLQMAMIPLSMSHTTIAALSETNLDIIIPFKRMKRAHILFGYLMIGLTLFATVGLLSFYSAMCASDVQEYCDRLTSEIMWTGYTITAGVIILGTTSYYRYQIPYEVFYAVHHLSIVLYIMTILHTLDNQFRAGRQRSQAFLWVSASSLYYLCDRVGARLNHSYSVRVASFSTVEGVKAKMVVLRLTRPTLFEFKPGQYVYLRVPQINNQWHPFSIASGSADSFLDFYIEVFGKESWTSQLWTLLDNSKNSPDVKVEVLGPYGTSILKAEDFSHALTVGTGTGIVPMMSLFNQHVGQLSKLAPRTHLRDMQRREQKVSRIERARER